MAFWWCQQLNSLLCTNGSVGSWAAALIQCTEEFQICVLMEDQLENGLSELSPLAELCGESWRPEEWEWKFPHWLAEDVALRGSAVSMLILNPRLASGAAIPRGDPLLLEFIHFARDSFGFLWVIVFYFYFLLHIILLCNNIIAILLLLK